jgi:hypothetical protein
VLSKLQIWCVGVYWFGDDDEDDDYDDEDDSENNPVCFEINIKYYNRKWPHFRVFFFISLAL